MRRIKGQTGMSLVEATIILLVLMMLTGVLAPSIYDFVIDAKLVLVKEDCEAIAVSVMRLVRDVGPCLMLNAANGCTYVNRADILYSEGGAPFIDGQPFNSIFMQSTNWNSTTNDDTLASQLITNNPGYVLPGAFAWNFSIAKPMLGWRGAYIQGPIEPDPWGHKYYVNTGFLSVAYDGYDVAQPGAGSWGTHHTEGDSDAGWNRDVFCISAGPDGHLKTNFAGNGAGGTNIIGDDFVAFLSGSTR